MSLSHPRTQKCFHFSSLHALHVLGTHSNELGGHGVGMMPPEKTQFELEKDYLGVLKT